MERRLQVWNLLISSLYKSDLVITLSGPVCLGGSKLWSAVPNSSAIYSDFKYAIPRLNVTIPCRTHKSPYNHFLPSLTDLRRSENDARMKCGCNCVTIVRIHDLGEISEWKCTILWFTPSSLSPCSLKVTKGKVLQRVWWSHIIEGCWLILIVIP